MTGSRHTSDLTHTLAKHQLGSVLPGGVACTCGAELAALNPPLSDGAVKGEPLALAVHQFEELEGLTPQVLDYVAEMSQLAQDNDKLRAALTDARAWLDAADPMPERNGDIFRELRGILAAADSPSPVPPKEATT